MKNTISIIGLIFLLSCENTDNKEVMPQFQEKQLSFSHLKSGYDKTNNWVKKPDNILMLHETFKKIGYTNLISEEEWVGDWNWYLDVNRSPKNLIDSLELTYENSEEFPKYYQEFWQRREKEGNSETVIKVVQEIKRIMSDNTEFSIKNEITNDTLFNLLAFEFPIRELKNEDANLHLDYLIRIGFHESAYNLISGENMAYENISWNKKFEDVLKELKETEKFNHQSPWFQDDTK